MQNIKTDSEWTQIDQFLKKILNESNELFVVRNKSKLTLMVLFKFTENTCNYLFKSLSSVIHIKQIMYADCAIFVDIVMLNQPQSVNGYNIITNFGSHPYITLF